MTSPAPQIPSIEASQLANQVAPNALAWQAENEQLHSILSSKNEEIQNLKNKLHALQNEQPEVKKPLSIQKNNQAEASASPASGWQSGEFTAYYPANDAMQGGGITAKGDNLYKSIYYQGYRVIAAPPSVPFNSIVEIKVSGQTVEGIVRDRGGAIKGNKFDLAYPDKSSAVNFGRQQGSWRLIK
ncbi:SPBc2 prophage-derived protein yorM [Listeria floridensis FSL S10-1187]|uniref:SPBc2 prophage-derived protein yorM n=1 Tax=Listeria floridensis FSL S10-1187 TaxID=1265817 RepID=A0ABP3ATQ1_9LIST|nr:3D domain-containing protein [Listeria floridensis]EUJ25247.1 SPBc2 prophage-derived protein yorM [Listeria floridensis FSL S10-1187]